MEGSRGAVIVLPEPGGPMSRTLCPPATAIASARLTSVRVIDYGVIDAKVVNAAARQAA